MDDTEEELVFLADEDPEVRTMKSLKGVKRCFAFHVTSKAQQGASQKENRMERGRQYDRQWQWMQLQNYIPGKSVQKQA